MPDITPSHRSVAVAVMVIARFLAATQPKFPRFIAESLAQAQAAQLTDSDLEYLRVIAKSIGAAAT